MLPIISVKEIISMAWLNCSLWQSLNHKWTKSQLHLHLDHLESLYRQLILPLEYCEWHNGHLDLEVVICWYIPVSHGETIAYCLVCSRRSPTHYWSNKGILLNLYALPPYIASLANHPIDIVFGKRNGDGCCVAGGIDSQTDIVDCKSSWKGISVPIWLRVSFFLISVT